MIHELVIYPRTGMNDEWGCRCGYKLGSREAISTMQARRLFSEHCVAEVQAQPLRSDRSRLGARYDGNMTTSKEYADA